LRRGQAGVVEFCQAEGFGEGQGHEAIVGRPDQHLGHVGGHGLDQEDRVRQLLHQTGPLPRGRGQQLLAQDDQLVLAERGGKVIPATPFLRHIEARKLQHRPGEEVSAAAVLAEVDALALQGGQVARHGGCQVLLDQQVQRLGVKGGHLTHVVQPAGGEAALNQGQVQLAAVHFPQCLFGADRGAQSQTDP
jgi:hypothetical protein